jgi:2,4-dienoyl-CoA reductase-like NADH-dependent reductase (Old Yellow Enzyme family)
MSILFTPTRIGTLEVPNRFVRSATGEGMCPLDGQVTDALVDLYRALAEGGVGLIITGHSFVRPDGKASEGMMGVHDDAMMPGLRQIVEAAHEAGSRIACQLNHAGRQTTPELAGTMPVAPSAVTNPVNDVTPRALEAGEMEPLIEAFVEAAVRAREAGFDGVQLHCAHGYLMSEFISPHTNRRNDGWGGSVARRARFPAEVLRRIRSRLGHDFPVLVKLNAEDFIGGGLTLAQSTCIAVLLEHEGIDAIEVSAGMAETVDQIMRTGVRAREQEGYFLPYVREFRHHLGVPLICVGGLRSRSVMEEVVETGAADLVSLCRPFIREPDLPRKLQNGQSERAACISCNKCTGGPRGPERRLRCALDAELTAESS